MIRTMNLLSRPCVALCLLLAAGCASVPEQPRQVGSEAVPAAMVAAVRAHAAADDAELAVQPLRDPRVEDLRADAARLEAAGDLAGAARALDEAMAIVGNDPALMQERAEVALLQATMRWPAAWPSAPTRSVPGSARCAGGTGPPWNSCARQRAMPRAWAPRASRSRPAG